MRYYTQIFINTVYICRLQNLESSISSSLKEMVSIGQRRLSSQRSIKVAEEETKELLNKPSTIPSEAVQDDVFIFFSIYSSH